ncbi:MAG TPA: ABC transporter substrate-binding protein [Chloroflexota bacterium]|jgi:NitT/TauT family transport system substrate-binding protein
MACAKFVLSVIAVVLLVACGSAASAPNPAPGPAPPAAEVVSPAGGAAAPAAPAPPRQQLTIGFSVTSAIHAGLYVAQDAGFLDRTGIDAELTDLGAGTPAQAAFLSGNLMVGSVSGPSTVNAVLAGGNLAMVGAVYDRMPFQLVATPESQTVADLRGKTIGINRLGGSPHWVLRYMLRHEGLDPEADVRVLQIGQQPERLAALRSGGIQATVVDPPFSVVAEREGLRILADAGDLGLAYPHSALVMNRDWLRTQRDTARRVLQSVVDGIRAFKSDRELGQRTLRKWLQIDDPALLDDAYAYFSRGLPDELLPRPEGLQLVIDEAASEQPAARDLHPDDLVDPSLSRELRQ